MTYTSRLEQWLAQADANTNKELAALDNLELEDRFYTELAFGTAGLRGLIGAGTNRMNTYVVRRATRGLCAYLQGIPDAAARGVAIAYDSRRYSDVFAKETALVLAQNGIRAFLFESLRAVPQLSFALRHLGCIAGVVITASHNPAAYNGYKVYWEHGGQLGPVQADAVLACINQVDYFGVEAMEETQALTTGLLTMIGRDVDEAYYEATQSLLLNPAFIKNEGAGLPIVYTPLHGAGCIPVKTLLNRVGFTNVHIVPAQEAPDGAFPTVDAPNPEDPQAFSLGIALANDVHADLILATDPDSDRLGIAVRKKDGSFATLSGNQIGCLLLEHILSAKKAAGCLPGNGLVAKSLVSTRLADVICARYQVQLDNVLTGFRYISEKIDEAERTGAHSFLFGFEESYGFLAGTFARDKDAICAAMLAAELASIHNANGRTLLDALQSLYETYGFFKESVKSYTLTGKAGMERIAFSMQSLREAPITALYGVPVATMEDYSTRRRTHRKQAAEEPISLPASNMIRLLFENGAWMVVRPSGTEPKLKLYIGANASTEQEVDTLLSAFLQEADARLSHDLFD